MPNGEVPASLSLRSPPLLLARQLDTSDLANKPMQRAEPLQWSFLQANFPKAGKDSRSSRFFTGTGRTSDGSWRSPAEVCRQVAEQKRVRDLRAWKAGGFHEDPWEAPQ